MLLKSTTRHIHIYTAVVEDNELVPAEQVLTLDVDPDNELNWNEDTLQQVYRQFDNLVESYSGEDLTEYNLRRIGSDLEYFVRSLLQSGQISYNLNSRVLNYSMGLPSPHHPITPFPAPFSNASYNPTINPMETTTAPNCGADSLGLCDRPNFRRCWS